MAYTARLLIHEVVTVKPTDTTAHAAKVMTDSNIGAVIVSEQGAKPLGIFTERDLCRRVVSKGKPVDGQVKDFMTTAPVMIEAGEPLDRVFEKLAEGKFRHLPITEGEEVVGIVSLTDLAKVLNQVYREDKYIQYFADVVQNRK